MLRIVQSSRIYILHRNYWGSMLKKGASVEVNIPAIVTPLVLVSISPSVRVITKWPRDAPESLVHFEDFPSDIFSSSEPFLRPSQCLHLTASSSDSRVTIAFILGCPFILLCLPWTPAYAPRHSPQQAPLPIAIRIPYEPLLFSTIITMSSHEPSVSEVLVQ